MSTVKKVGQGQINNLFTLVNTVNLSKQILYMVKGVGRGGGGGRGRGGGGGGGRGRGGGWGEGGGGPSVEKLLLIFFVYA